MPLTFLISLWKQIFELQANSNQNQDILLYKKSFVDTKSQQPCWEMEKQKFMLAKIYQVSTSELSAWVLKKYICCVAKAILRGKFIAIEAYVKNEERPEIKNLTSSLKRFKNEEQTKSKISRRKEK